MQRGQILPNARLDIGRLEQISNDGHGRGARRDDLGRPFQRNPPDRHDWCASARGVAHEIQPARAIAGLLRTGVVDRTYRDVVRAGGERLVDLRPIVRRQANQTRAKNRPNGTRREIVLANMYAPGARGPSNIGAVVDDDGSRVWAGLCNQRVGQFEEGGGRPGFDPELHDDSAATKAGRRDGTRIVPHSFTDLRIDERVETVTGGRKQESWLGARGFGGFAFD
jgi:hypothetical protein